MSTTAPSTKKCDRAPRGEEHPDEEKKGHSARAILSVLDCSWRFPTTVFPPGHPIAQEEGKTEGENQLRKQVLEVEGVVHCRTVTPR